MAITLDGTNGIGVGATPSDAKIEAREDSSTSYPTLLKLTNGQNYGYGARMEFAQPLTNGGGIVTSAQIDSGYDGTGKGNLNFRTVDNGSSLQAMSIDSAGRVTMPYQPAFKAYDSTGTTWSSTNLIPNVAILNRGNCYSTSTGRFTAPVAGFYVFKADWRNAGSTGWMDIRASNGEIARHEEAGQTTVNQYHQSLVLMVYLSAGDYVWIEAGTQVRWDPNSIDSFAGYLAG